MYYHSIHSLVLVDGQSNTLIDIFYIENKQNLQ